MNTTIRTRIEELEKELATLKATEPIMKDLHSIDFFEEKEIEIFSIIEKMFIDGTPRQDFYDNDWTDTFEIVYASLGIENEWKWLRDNVYECITLSNEVTDGLMNTLLIPLQMIFEKAEKQIICFYAEKYLRTWAMFDGKFIRKFVDEMYENRYIETESHFNDKEILEISINTEILRRVTRIGDKYIEELINENK